eukprot:9363010-Karenia_brevis.AAC.1
MGPLVQEWRNRQMRRLGRLTKALRPLDAFALTQRPGHAHFVSQGQPAVSLAMLVVLLGWPD